MVGGFILIKKVIDGHALRRAIILASNELSVKRAYLDGLNVFPVPDGDTGINMSLTTYGAAKEAYKLDTGNIYDVAKAISSGSLRGARGNSGVILSQLFRGFAKGLEGKEAANAMDLAIALKEGAEMSYKAVMKPKEGTVLTVARAIGDCAIKTAFETDDIYELLEIVIKEGHEVLKETQNMLPELKAAGVVDAGGMGLMCIIEGCYQTKTIKMAELVTPSSEEPAAATFDSSNFSHADIKFAYCTEFFINTENATQKVEDELKKYLDTMGDSVVVVADMDIIKIHVHTNNPGAVLERAITIGTLSSIKIDNMKEQHESLLQSQQEEQSKEKKAIGFIAVSQGDGFKKFFKDLGVDYVIEGGQSMNPATEDFLSAIDAVNADKIVIFPNNKNIILAAEQAASLSEKDVCVIKSKTIPQGVSALVNDTVFGSIEERIAVFEEAIGNITTGLVTYAVKDSNFDGNEILEGDILLMLEGQIKLVSKDVAEGSKNLIDAMFKERDGSFLSIYYGEEVSLEAAEELADYTADKYPDCDVEIIKGGQALYYYTLSLE